MWSRKASACERKWLQNGIELMQARSTGLQLNGTSTTECRLRRQADSSARGRSSDVRTAWCAMPCARHMAAERKDKVWM